MVRGVVILIASCLALLPSSSEAEYLRSLKETEEGLKWTIFKPSELKERLTEHGIRRHLQEGEPNVRLSHSMVASLSQLATKETALEMLQVGKTIPLPMPDGSVVDFVLQEYSVMHPDLQAKFPDIRTFTAKSVGVEKLTANLDYSEFQGFHGQVFTPDGEQFYIDPYTRFETELYTVYSVSENVGKVGEEGIESAADRGWSCADRREAGVTKAPIFPPTGRRLASEMAYDEHHSGAPRRSNTLASILERNRKLQQLSAPINTGTFTPRKYRLAVSANYEYSTYHGGAAGPAPVMAAIVTAVTRVTGIYKRDLAVFLELVPDNDKLIQTTTAATPRLLNSADVIDQNQAFTDNLIGVANYDVGHAFSTGSGGLAGLGVFCGPRKAEGTTGLGNPTGDAFYVDYVAHEIGHQIGMEHTFSGGSGSCQGNMSNNRSYEPGSGTTIMGYAGICGPDNVQPNSDSLFHVGSLFDAKTCMENPAETCGQCGTPIQTNGVTTYPSVAVTNTVPKVPVGAKFKLTPESVEPNTIYSWEQLEATQTPIPLNAPPGEGPLFRAFKPTKESPERFIPNIQAVIAGAPNPAEKMPTAPGTTLFALVARNVYDAVGGQGDAALDGFGNFNLAAVEVEFVAVAPLTVAADMIAATVAAGETTDIKWTPGGTATIAPTVNVRMSIDGGKSFPHVFSKAIPNTGTASIEVPTTGCTQPSQILQARVIIESSESVGFYEISPTVVTVNCPLQVPETAAPTNSLGQPANGTGDNTVVIAAVGVGAVALLAAGVVYKRSTNNTPRGAVVGYANPNAGVMSPFSGGAKSFGQMAPGWRSAVDPSSGRTYYYNAAGQTSWTVPGM